MIEVRIPQARLAALNNEVHVGMHILSELRAAGVPAEGTLFVRGVTAGSLQVEFDDLASDEWVWTWRT